MELINQEDDKGNREGLWKGYYSNGKKQFEATYKGGSLHGPVTYYNHNETIFFKGTYEMYNAVGLWIHYHTDGTYRNTIFYAR